MANSTTSIVFSGQDNSGFQVGSNHGHIYHITNIYHVGPSNGGGGSGGVRDTVPEPGRVQNSFPEPFSAAQGQPASGDRRPIPAPRAENIERRSRQRFSLNRLLGKGAESASLQEPTNQSEPHRLNQLRTRQRISKEVIAGPSQSIASESENQQTNQRFQAVPIRDSRHTTGSVSNDLSLPPSRGSTKALLMEARKLSDKKDYATAEAMYRRALRRYEAALGGEHPETLKIVNWLAWVLANLRKYEEAEKFYRLAWVGRGKVLGNEHPDTLNSAFNLGRVLERRHKYQEAEGILRQAWESMEKVLGKEHPETLFSMSDLGSFLSAQGKYEEAEGILRQAWESMEKVLGKEHPEKLTIMSDLGFVLSVQGKHEEAEGMCRLLFDRDGEGVVKETPSHPLQYGKPSVGARRTWQV